MERQLQEDAPPSKCRARSPVTSVQLNVHHHRWSVPPQGRGRSDRLVRGRSPRRDHSALNRSRWHPREACAACDLFLFSPCFTMPTSFPPCKETVRDMQATITGGNWVLVREWEGLLNRRHGLL